MWYAVQTPTGREAEMAEKLNRVYSGESDKPCFVLSKERSWRMGGIYHIGVEPMFPGYIFVDTDDAGELEQKIGILAGSAKLPLDEKAVPLEGGGRFPETSASRGSAAYGKTISRTGKRGGRARVGGRHIGRVAGTDCAETNPKTGCDAGDTDAGSSTAGRTGDPCKRR